MKYTEDGLWVSDPQVASGTEQAVTPPNPKVILSPLRSGTNTFGIGQPTVIEYQGGLRMWYTDTSANQYGQTKVYLLESGNPVNWTPQEDAEVKDLAGKSSTGIMYDENAHIFYILRTEGYPYSYLLSSTSTDGTHWERFNTLIPPGQFPNNAKSVVISSNPKGHIVDRQPLLAMFSAPSKVTFLTPPSLVEADTAVLNIYGILFPYSFLSSSEGNNATIDEGTIGVQIKVQGLPEGILISKAVLYKEVDGGQREVQVVFPSQKIVNDSNFLLKFTQACLSGEKNFKVVIDFRTPPSAASSAIKTFSVDNLNCHVLSTVTVPHI
jgi:hypothetical protein